MKLLVLATGDIFLPAFSWLLQQPNLDIRLLVSQPDRPVGRAKKLTSPQIVVQAKEAGIDVFQPENLKQRKSRQKVEEWGPFDLGIVMAYGQILTSQLLAIPRLGCWNLHASLLPKYRGAAPIQAALLAGEQATGISVMQVEPSLDAGPVLHQEQILLRPDHTGGSLHDELALVALKALQAALLQLEKGELKSEVQDPLLATHVGKLTRLDGELNPVHESALEMERRVRAFDPWPGTSVVQELKPGGEKVAIKLFPPVQILPTPEGVVLNGKLQPCPNKETLLLPAFDGNCLQFSRLQIPGKPVVLVKDFLRGYPLFGE